jgi:hypothetical protein
VVDDELSQIDRWDPMSDDYNNEFFNSYNQGFSRNKFVDTVKMGHEGAYRFVFTVISNTVELKQLKYDISACDFSISWYGSV